MTQIEQLIASLGTVDNTGYYLDEERYIDWSSRTAGGGVTLEVGPGTDRAVQVDMTRNDVLALQQRLTAWLLANPA